MLQLCVFDLKNACVSNLGHRHDQFVLSILKTRYRLPVVGKPPALNEWKSLEYAKQNNNLFYEHRVFVLKATVSVSFNSHIANKWTI